MKGRSKPTISFLKAMYLASKLGYSAAASQLYVTKYHELFYMKMGHYMLWKQYGLQSIH